MPWVTCLSMPGASNDNKMYVNYIQLLYYSAFTPVATRSTDYTYRIFSIRSRSFYLAGVMLRSAPQPDNLSGESQLSQTLACLCKCCPINKILAGHSTLFV